jgi:hypothetical protein
VLLLHKVILYKSILVLLLLATFEHHHQSGMSEEDHRHTISNKIIHHHLTFNSNHITLPTIMDSNIILGGRMDRQDTPSSILNSTAFAS